MGRFDEIVEILDVNGALQLGESPWKQDVHPEDVDIYEVDWSRLFPSRRPKEQEGTPWDLYGDEWEINIDNLGDILEPHSHRVIDAGHEWDVCAWYQPIHFHGYDWGIFIREECLRRLARMIYGELLKSNLGSAAMRPSLTLVKALLRTAFSAYYHHELYHHKTECFGLRSHAVEGKSSYLPYFKLVYSPNKGTDNQLEEALANAYMYRDLGESPWIPAPLADAAKEHLQRTFPYDPPSYRLAPMYLARSEFDDGQRGLFCQIHDGLLFPSSNPAHWLLSPRINHSFFNIHSEIWTVLPKGKRPLIPTTSTPLRTCSTQDMIKVCERQGYAIVPGGKGSHIKLKKSGKPMLIIPSGRDNLSPGVTKNILAVLGQRIPDLPGLL